MKYIYLLIVTILFVINCERYIDNENEYFVKGNIFSATDSLPLQYSTITIASDVKGNSVSYKEKISSDLSGYYAYTYITQNDESPFEDDVNGIDPDRINIKDINIHNTYQATGYKMLDTTFHYPDILTEYSSGKRYPKYVLPNVYLQKQ